MILEDELIQVESLQMEIFYQLSEIDKHMRVFVNESLAKEHRQVVNSGCIFSRSIRQTLYSYFNTNELFKKLAALSREERIITNQVAKKKKSELKLLIPNGPIRFFAGYASHLLNFSERVTVRIDNKTDQDVFSLFIQAVPSIR